MATINVSSTAALNTALKAAKAGDTILLSTGTYTLNTSGLTFASDVTIASATVGRPAVISGMTIDEKDAVATSTYQGKTDYFCSEDCKTTFDESPEDYADQDKDKR